MPCVGAQLFPSAALSRPAQPSCMSLSFVRLLKQLDRGRCLVDDSIAIELARGLVKAIRSFGEAGHTISSIFCQI